jgi:hypothetical protein
MAIIRSTVPVGTKPPKDVIKRIKEAAKHPIVYTEDSPESTPVNNCFGSCQKN